MLHWVGTVISAFALVVVTVVAAATVVVPRFIGATPYTVLTGSMRPTFEPGALILVRPVSDPADIDVGDVLTYQLTSGRPEVVTHRVVGLGARADGEPTFITRGDANSASDPAGIRAVQVRGVVAYAIPWLGYVNSAVNTATRNVIVIIAAVILISYGLWLLGTEARTRRRPRQDTATRA